MPDPRYFENTFDGDSAPDYFKDAHKPPKPRRADWKKHEADVEKRTGDRRQPGSGNHNTRGSGIVGKRVHGRGSTATPADNKGKSLRECKAFIGKSGSISVKWLTKLVEQAAAHGLPPIVELRFEAAADAEFPTPTDWVLVPVADYDDLEERADAHRDQ